MMAGSAVLPLQVYSISYRQTLFLSIHSPELSWVPPICYESQPPLQLSLFLLRHPQHLCLLRRIDPRFAMATHRFHNTYKKWAVREVG